MGVDSLNLMVDQYNQSSVDLLMSDPALGISISQKAYDISLSINYQRGLAEGLLNIGRGYAQLASFIVALQNLEAAEFHFKKLNDIEGIIQVKNAFGLIYNRLGKYDKSLDFFSISLEESRKHHFVYKEITALLNIGNLCLELGDIQEAANHLEQARELSASQNDKETTGKALLKLGHVYLNLGSSSKAAGYLKEAEGIFEECDNKFSQSEVWTLRGRLAQQQGNYDLSRKYHHKSLDLSRSIGDRFGESSILMNLGQLCMVTQKYDEAIVLFQDAVNLSKAIDSPQQVSQSYKFLSQIYSYQEKYKEALQYYRLFYSLDKEFVNKEMDRKLNNLKIQFEIEKKEEQNRIYRNKNRDLKKQSERLEEYSRRLELINHIGQKLTASLDIETIINVLYLHIIKIIPVDGFLLGLIEEDSIRYYKLEQAENRIKIVKNLSDKENKLFRQCLKNQKTFLKNNLKKSVKSKKEKEVWGSSLYVPFFYEEEILGVLAIENKKEGIYNKENRSFLQAIGTSLSIAISNSRVHAQLNLLNSKLKAEKAQLEDAYEQIDYMANHDNLTGLPNRRLLSEFLKQSISIAKRTSSRLAILYLDLDNFKPVNDQAGHEIGDKVLKLVAKRIQGTLRDSDIIARVGGDEFVVILPMIGSMKNAESAAKKIINILSVPIEVDDHFWSIGVSIGGAFYPDDGVKIDRLLQKADSAMYSIKQKEKNNYTYTSA